MLADAIRSEAYRFSKNRMAVFWSLGFVPVIVLVIGTLAHIFMKSKMVELNGKLPPEITATSPVNLGETLVEAAGSIANPMVLLFLLIGAAIIYAGDYRWETWRLTTARNTRANLLHGKVATVVGLALIGMVICLVAAFIGDIAKGVIYGRPLTFSFDGKDAGHFLALGGLTWLRIVQFTMISLLAAVFSRSLLAALFIPLVVAVAQFFFGQSLPLFGLEPSSWTAQLLLPSLAADTLKAMIIGGPAAAMMPAGVTLKAVIGLGLWILAPLAGAIALFQRQDLSKE